ncbi:MAG: lipase [Aeromicrobium erythreum]
MSRHQGWRRAVLGAAAALLVSTLAPAPAGAATAATGGWNDWSCRPSAAHPQPVVLLHGLGAQEYTNWVFHGTALAGRGYCVFSTTYGEGLLGELVGGLGSMRASAREVGEFVDRVRAATGSAQVDLVGHSEGSTVAVQYMKAEGGASKVKDYVGFGTNYRGTSLSGLGVLAKAAIPLLPSTAAFVQSQCASCLEYLPPNDFLDDLARGGFTVPGPRYTNIMSRLDSVVTPYTSGRIDEPGVTNIVLQSVCPLDVSGHLGMAADRNVTLLIERALDPQAPPPMRCSLVPPIPV